MHGSCEILINEIVLQSGGYVELAKICPPTTQQQNQKTDLNGFVLVLMNANGANLTFQQVNQLDAVDLVLSNFTLPSSNKNNRQGSHLTGGTRCRVGSNDKSNTTRSNRSKNLTTSDEQRQTNAKYFRTININKPRLNDTTAIVLLHQNAQERRRAISYKENQVVSDVLLAKIQAEVHDAVVVASLSENMDHRLMFLSENKQPLNPLVWPNAEDLLIDFGFSKCDQHQKLFNPQGFKYSLKSPQFYRAEKQLEVTGTIDREYKRKKFESVVSNLNDEIRAIIYEAITSFYQQKLVPTLRPIFDRFVHCKYISTADTHAVIEKSWVRSCYASLQERRDFSLKKYKPSKGRRLIIVAAGNEDGFIEESIFVKQLAKELPKPKTITIISTLNRFESGFLNFWIHLIASAQKSS
ncbi:unnamed protein product [Allacma fusca]|uniref:Uncharacterized protein n=1 Tax=Allacma fusca TaxID=39272 RepID=A0A8J2PQC8_9HEXA|nr:unnamed protein product [Allacma fusca]